MSEPAFSMSPNVILNDENGWAIVGGPIRGRRCGNCKACCTLVPVELPDGNKPANSRCKHLCSRGCSIYAKRPLPCQYWSCKWLFDPMAAGLQRPDIGGYVVDPMLDTGMHHKTQAFEFVQVWVDPGRPEAHRAPELRAYIDAIGARYGIPTMIRRGSAIALLLIPPSLGGGKWIERESEQVTREVISDQLQAQGLGPLYGAKS